MACWYGKQRSRIIIDCHSSLIAGSCGPVSLRTNRTGYCFGRLIDHPKMLFKDTATSEHSWQEARTPLGGTASAPMGDGGRSRPYLSPTLRRTIGAETDDRVFRRGAGKGPFMAADGAQIRINYALSCIYAGGILRRIVTHDPAGRACRHRPSPSLPSRSFDQ